MGTKKRPNIKIIYRNKENQRTPITNPKTITVRHVSQTETSAYFI